MQLLSLIENSELITKEQYQKLTEIKDQILKSFNTVQVFRTQTEMEISILNDVNFPNPDSKYWQAVREQNVMFTELITLTFEYRRNQINICEIQESLETATGYKKDRLQIDLEEKEFTKLNMQRVSSDRIREILEWQAIKDKLELQLVASDTDVNEHQLISYTQRWIQQYIAMANTGSPAERWNLIGQLDKGLRLCIKNNLLEKVINIFDMTTKEWLTNKLIPEILGSDYNGR